MDNTGLQSCIVLLEFQGELQLEAGREAFGGRCHVLSVQESVPKACSKIGELFFLYGFFCMM